MDKEVIETIGKEVKADVQKVEAKATEIAAEVKTLSENNNKIQSQLDALEAKTNRAGRGADAEVKTTLVSAIEAKPEFKSFTKGSKQVEIKAPVDMLRSNTVANSQTQITAGAYVGIQNRMTHVRDFLRIGKLSTPVYTYDRELPTEGKPGVTAEGARKPKISFSTVPVTANAVKIASHYKLTTELLHDAPAFAYSLQGRGIELTLQEEDYQLLYGNGTSGNIQGLMPLATPFNPGNLRVTNAQAIDVIRAAVAQVRKSMFRANVVLMNPTDVAALELTKDLDGRYLLPNIMSGAISTVSRIQIAEIDAVEEGEFFVGALDLAVETFMVEDLLVKVSDSNEADFVENKITVVIEERLIQAVTRPLALVKGDFESAKAALEAPLA